MAWGIFMTGLMLFGMLGIAMFQATSDDRPSRGPIVKRKAHSSEKELKKVA